MSITYPTTLDSFPNPTSTDLMENATLALDHDQQHSNANDAIEALEAKVGVNSSAVTTTIDYKLSGVPASDKASSLTGTETLTNKRVPPRTGTTTSSATPTINTDNVDYYSITAQSGNITSMTTNLSGTPTDGQTLWIAMTAVSGTPTITWGTGWEASSIALPTGLTTTRQDFRFVWNSTTSKWRFVGYA